jgi:hypothetical protein
LKDLPPFTCKPFGQSNKKPFVFFAYAFLRSCPNLRVILTMDMTLKIGEALGAGVLPLYEILLRKKMHNT